MRSVYSQCDCVPSSKVTCTLPRMLRKNAVRAVAWVGRIVRAITRPLSSRTTITVVAWCTSSPAYLDVRFMRAAPGCDLWFGDASTVAVRGVLSISVSAALLTSTVPEFHDERTELKL